MKRGAEPMKLADALAAYCANAIDVTPPAHEGLRFDRLQELVACLRNRQAEAESIARISRQTLPLLEQVRDRLDDQSFVNRTISQIDGLRSEMHKLANTFHAVMQLSQGTELKKFIADRKITAAKLDGALRQRRQVERDIDNVRSVIDAASVFVRLMDDVIARVQAMPQFTRTTAREAA
jgi:hypothetical protein